MERKLSKLSAWHPQCFCCHKCAKAFQNNHYVYEGSDKEIYCKTCFKKTFPENETPQIFADTSKVNLNSNTRVPADYELCRYLPTTTP